MALLPLGFASVSSPSTDRYNCLDDGTSKTGKNLFLEFARNWTVSSSDENLYASVRERCFDQLRLLRDDKRDEIDQYLQLLGLKIPNSESSPIELLEAFQKFAHTICCLLYVLPFEYTEEFRDTDSYGLKARVSRLFLHIRPSFVVDRLASEERAMKKVSEKLDRFDPLAILMDPKKLLRVFEVAYLYGVVVPFEDRKNGFPRLLKGSFEDRAEEVCSWLGSCTISELDCRGLKMPFFPVEFCLPTLRKIDLEGNVITVFPSSINLLRNLNTLILDSNLLSELPPEIVGCTCLELLSLSRNFFRSIPREIEQLPDSCVTNLSHNLIEEWGSFEGFKCFSRGEQLFFGQEDSLRWIQEFFANNPSEFRPRTFLLWKQGFRDWVNSLSPGVAKRLPLAGL